jgi:hypothetical protein
VTVFLPTLAIISPSANWYSPGIILFKSFYFKIFMESPPSLKKRGWGRFFRYNFTHKAEFSSAKSPLPLFVKEGGIFFYLII